MARRKVGSAGFKFYPFSRKQKQVLTWWLPESGVSDKDGIIADGAVRSGKTVCMALSFVMWAMATFSGETLGMAGKTIGAFRRNVLAPLKRMLRSRGYRYREHRSDNMIEITYQGVTNYFYIFGGKDERSHDLNHGITLVGMGLIYQTFADDEEHYLIPMDQVSPLSYVEIGADERLFGKDQQLSCNGLFRKMIGTNLDSKNFWEVFDPKIRDNAYLFRMGVGDYNSVIRSSLRLIGRAGLQVQYESGYHKRLDTAIRQNILDGVRQVQQQAQKVIGEQIGADGVEISAHPNSAPDHEPVQGRQFLVEEFEKMQSGFAFEDADGKHYSGFERPITEWHCRHLVFYILLGASKRMYTDEQLKKWEEENHKGCEIDGKHYTTYEATQLMRKIETEIRKEKDTAILAQASGDDVLRRKSQSNIALTAKYKHVAEAADLRTRFEKTRVAGYSSKHAKEAAQHEKYLQYIQDDATIKSKSGLPKKLVDLPNEELQHTVNIDMDKTEKLINGFHAVAPKGSKLTSVEIMAGARTSTPIRDLKRLYM